jgi:hypothetical protein
MTRTAPLAKDKVTQGSQVILPAYPILFLLIAGFFLFQNESRTQGDAFAVALMVLSIKGWGLVFLTIGAVEVSCLFSHRRIMFMWSLVLGAGMCTFWSILLFASATRNDSVSWTSGVWVLFAAVAHIASVRSLARDDVRM